MIFDSHDEEGVDGTGGKHTGYVVSMGIDTPDVKPEKWGELDGGQSQSLNYVSNCKENRVIDDPYSDYVISMGMDAPDVKPSISREHKSRHTIQAQKVETLRLRTGCAPPRELTVNIVQLHRQVAKVNDRILSGLVVSEEDWISLRKNVSDNPTPHEAHELL
jgi:hypothetical protein